MISRAYRSASSLHRFLRGLLGGKARPFMTSSPARLLGLFQVSERLLQPIRRAIGHFRPVLTGYYTLSSLFLHLVLRIERKTGTSGTFAQFATVGANVTSYIDSGLTSGTTFCYRLLAYNVAGDSAYSNEACGTTPQDFSLTVVRAGTGSGTEGLGRLRQQRVHEALEAVELVDAQLQQRDGQAVGIHAPHDPLDGHRPLLVGRRELNLYPRPHRRARVRRPQPHLHAERAQGDDLPFPFEAGAPSHGDVPRDLHARIPAPLLRLNSPLALTDHAAFLRSGNGNEDATEGGAWEVIYLRRARARFWSGTGLEITSVTPRRRASSSWHGLTHPERMMTGSRRCHSRIARKTSIPSIPGMMMSRKTASGGFSV